MEQEELVRELKAKNEQLWDENERLRQEMAHKERLWKDSQLHDKDSPDRANTARLFDNRGRYLDVAPIEYWDDMGHVSFTVPNLTVTGKVRTFLNGRFVKEWSPEEKEIKYSCTVTYTLPEDRILND